MKIIFILFFLFSTTLVGQTSGKSVAGKYIGFEAGEVTMHTDKKGREKTVIENYLPKTLLLKSDSSFLFDFDESCVLCTQAIKSYSCSGKWSFFKDTVYLRSKFTANDFLEVNEFYEPTQENKLIKFAL